jgi:catechol 2,3-dioxygenase-like lactoylglutathione lyase family enzyme
MAGRQQSLVFTADVVLISLPSSTPGLPRWSVGADPLTAIYGSVYSSMIVDVIGAVVSRVQLAINVSDLEAALTFYSRVLEVQPAKVRPGYANFVVTDPPLKLVLVESADSGGTLNHLGVEVEDAEDVGRFARRLTDGGFTTATEEGVTCCFAIQDKVWTTDPDGLSWEFYRVLSDADEPGGSPRCPSGTC